MLARVAPPTKEREVPLHDRADALHDRADVRLADMMETMKKETGREIEIGVCEVVSLDSWLTCA